MKLDKSKIVKETIGYEVGYERNDKVYLVNCMEVIKGKAIVDYREYITYIHGTVFVEESKDVELVVPMDIDDPKFIKIKRITTTDDKLYILEMLDIVDPKDIINPIRYNKMNIRNQKFDEKGLLLSEEKGTKYQEYTYDELDRKIKETHVDGMIFVLIEIEYHGDTNVIKKKRKYSTCSRDGDIDYRETHEYNEYGDLVYNSFYPLKSIQIKKYYTYDENRNLVEHRKDSIHAGKESSMNEVYEYDQDGHMTKKIERYSHDDVYEILIRELIVE